MPCSLVKMVWFHGVGRVQERMNLADGGPGQSRQSRARTRGGDVRGCKLERKGRRKAGERRERGKGLAAGGEVKGVAWLQRHRETGRVRHWRQEQCGVRGQVEPCRKSVLGAAAARLCFSSGQAAELLLHDPNLQAAHSRGAAAAQSRLSASSENTAAQLLGCAGNRQLRLLSSQGAGAARRTGGPPRPR